MTRLFLSLVFVLGFLSVYTDTNTNAAESSRVSKEGKVTCPRYRIESVKAEGGTKSYFSDGSMRFEYVGSRIIHEVGSSSIRCDYEKKNCRGCGYRKWITTTKWKNGCKRIKKGRRFGKSAKYKCKK
ncbi:MAG: hypothetical protein HOJ35_06005 [Bdellovibrionales bacterium]|jgi:hypothetical protein|nr:hypothetical protein [Bdellovibrionales bacterium]